MVSQRVLRAALLARGHKRCRKYKKGQNVKKKYGKHKQLVFANMQYCW